MFWVLEFILCQNTWVTILCGCLFQIYSVHCAMNCVWRKIIEVLFGENYCLLLLKVRF